MWNEKTIQVDAKKIKEALKFCERLAKKAEKAGQPFLFECGEKYKISDVQYVEVQTMTGAWSLRPQKIVREVYDLTFKGTLVMVDGWRVVGHAEDLGHGMKIKMIEGKVPARLRGDFEQTCDHCEHKRNRKKLWILRKQDGRSIKVVGTSCVRDFTGHDGSFQNLANWDQIVRDLWFGEGEGIQEFTGFSQKYFDLQRVAAAAALMIGRFGFVSRRKSEIECLVSTAQMVDGVINRADLALEDGWAEAQKVADMAIRAAKKIGKEKRTEDIFHNMHMIANADSVDASNFGMVAWIVQWAIQQKEAQKRSSRKGKNAKFCGVSKKIGSIGERLDLRVKVLGSRNFNSHYGGGTKFDLVTECGSLLAWWCSGYDQGLEVDGVFTIKATVKKHGEWRGEDWTTVNRVAVCA